MEQIINLEAESALRERVAWYSIIITATDKDFEHGTGIPIIYKEKYFIVTCLHIVKDILPNKLRFIWRTADSLILTGKQEIGKKINDKKFNYNTIKEFSIKKIHKSSDIVDLAVIELNKVTKNNVAFFELHKDSFDTPRVGLEVMMMGYPGEIAIPVKNIKTAELGNIGFLYTDWPEIIEYKETLDELPYFAPEDHFLMKTYKNDQSVSPKGMSGCGIWSWEKAISNRLWYPKIKLVGIQCAEYTINKLLKAIKVDSLFKLLDRFLK